MSVKRRMAHEILADLQKKTGKEAHPLIGLLTIALNEDNPVELRASCFRDALPYVLPRLQQSAVAVGGSLEVDSGPSVEINIGALIKGDAALSDAAQKLAMAMCEADVAALDAVCLRRSPKITHLCLPKLTHPAEWGL